MDILEKDDEVIFLKKVRNGASDNSYGIHVAKLAGLPDIVLDKAKKILGTLLLSPKGIQPVKQPETSEPQILLFSKEEIISKEIKGLDILNTTPLKALNLLSKWQKELKG